jgi:hypothetical protein
MITGPQFQTLYELGISVSYNAFIIIYNLFLSESPDISLNMFIHGFIQINLNFRLLVYS